MESTLTVATSLILRVIVAAAVTSDAGNDISIDRVWCSPNPKKSSPASSATRTASKAFLIAYAVLP